MVHIDKLENGLILIVEPIKHFSSVSYDLHIPGGIVADTDTNIGNALLLPELTERGAADLNSRQLSDAYDLLGARHGSSSASDRFIYRSTVLPEALLDSLKLTSMQVLNPSLPLEEIPSILELLIMDAKSLDDSPARKASTELTKRFLPEPFNRSSYVQDEYISKINLTNVTELYKRCFNPDAAILSVAGQCVYEEVKKDVEILFGNWKGKANPQPEWKGLPLKSSYHIKKDTAQVQICLCYPSANFFSPLYYPAKVLAEVLSGGMFGRLFIEVREQRGLCYSVNARHSGGRHVGSVFAYSGTTPDRASETLKVMLDVIKGCSGTITEEELNRAKVNLKSSLVISEESPSARASSNASDYWMDKNIRTLTHISDSVDKVTLKDLDAVLNEFPPDNFSIVTLGPKEVYV